MKKLLALILTLATLLVLVACGEAPITPTEAESEYISGVETPAEPITPPEPESEFISGVETLDKYVSYADAQVAVDAKRDKQYADSNATPIEDLKKFFPEYSGEPLLTQEEIEEVKGSTSNETKSVTYDEAIYDVDIYFRMLKYAYGGYYYFGGDEAFGAAKEKVLKNVEEAFKNSVETIGGGELSNYLYKSVMFVRDMHFSVGGSSPACDTRVNYKYFYCKGQNYALDDVGYYKLIDGKKWHYVGCDGDAVSMQYSLDDEGRIVYSLVRFCPKYNENGERIPDENVITLKNGDKTKKQKIEWIENEAYTTRTTATDFKYFKENGIAYISIRAFPTSYGGVMDEFAATGADVKDAKVIIYDTRSNGGGSDGPSKKWSANLTGDYSEYRVWTNRKTALSYDPASLGKEYTQITYNRIKRIANDIPIIFLTDYNSGSSGESVWFTTTSIKNVTVIGSNTAGCMICGNVGSRFLLNSNVKVTFGSSLGFHIDHENLDGKGFEPDIWCNPADALDLAFKLAVNYNFATEEDTVEVMKNVYKEAKVITMMLDGQTTSFTSAKKIGGYVDEATVYFNGKTITDFTVVSNHPEYGKVENVNGKLVFTPLVLGKRCIVSIFYHGKYTEFTWDINKMK